MNKANIQIGDRKFELEINYDCFEGEEVLPMQEEAVKKICTGNYLSIKILEEVKKYCKNRNADKFNQETIPDIFRFVKPVSLYIKRNKEKRIVAVMCDYVYDMEHGLAIVFENEEFKGIRTQAAVL